ncbi:S8 family serine peptidase [Umezawaea tangerina]|uniref:Subtilase family protein n=1 Tax=Umezawaea tangerina TaxID=84725 RepID=A0A2T0SX18_9PSEU|nr:S8 family serine peptidase [Umezawaea tangerina]PRY37939.1 subtilase family protein [Umezawaea tangerina]
MLRGKRGLLAGSLFGVLLVAAGGVTGVQADPAPADSGPRFIRLANRTFDPLDAQTAAVATAGNGSYLVQFRGNLTDQQRRRLRAMGARVGTYVPDFAYVVRMSDTTRKQVERLSFVRAAVDFQAADKMDATAATEGRYLVTLAEQDTKDQRVVANRIAGLGGKVEQVSASGQHLTVLLGADQVAAVAGLPEVIAVGADSAPETDMAIARETSGANAIEAAGGYTGKGVRGEVMDGGLRATHQEFAARPPLLHGPNSTDTSHGTSTYGEIFASGVSTAHRGMLPEAQGILATYTGKDRYAHTKELVDPAGPYRAVFQSNSWGDALTTSYTSISAQMDKIVFDTDLLICQSQSNAGTRSSRPQAWAKNVLSVGGQYHFNTADRSDDKWNSGGSIGPAADGRIKPDVSNYYDRIDTTSSSNDASYTTSFGGTSGATPITCGNAGLLFQMWADGVFSGGPGKAADVFAARPHASTAKALLVNTANQYPFTGTAHDMTRTHQGWGSASVGNLHALAEANGWSLPVLVDETDLVSTGDVKSYTVTSDGTKPLRATLAYTDPAGTPGAALARVNDLTLRLTAPDGTVYYGNNGLSTGVWSTPGGSANTVDNVENVFVDNAAAGTWTVEVIASEVNADGHVETAATDADYALVVS